jgi:predicted nucleic acid-binding protein
MFYLDTSFIVSALTADEVFSEQSRDWLAANKKVSMVISDWVTTEVSSALSLKVRTQELSLTQRAEILIEWNRFRGLSLAVVSVSRRDFQAAASFAQQHILGLRAGDALHLALTESAGARLVTLDTRMSAAAVQLGILVAEF